MNQTTRAITAVSDGSNFAASGYGADVTREDVAATLTKVLPVLRTMKERLPDDYAIVGDYYGQYVSGQAETEIIAATRCKLLSIITAYRPLANDAVLVDLGKLLAEEFAALGAKDPTLCYVFASWEGGMRDFSSDIPEYLTQRAIAVDERVVATAASTQTSQSR
jgi:hypothetical protein